MREPHNATLLCARGRYWVECTCGFLTGLGSQAWVLAEHARHVGEAKR